MSRDGRGAFEWGLASLLMGGVLTIAATTAMWAGETVASAASLAGWSDATGAAVTMCMPAAMDLLSLLSLAAGLRSVLLARLSGRPKALGLCGMTLGLTAVALWAMTGGAWYVTLKDWGLAPTSYTGE